MITILVAFLRKVSKNQKYFFNKGILGKLGYIL